MNELLKIAQQVASQIEPPSELMGRNIDPSKIDMSKIIEQVKLQFASHVDTFYTKKLDGALKLEAGLTQPTTIIVKKDVYDTNKKLRKDIDKLGMEHAGNIKIVFL